VSNKYKRSGAVDYIARGLAKIAIASGGGGTGTVTSVSGTGTVAGLSLSGTVTAAGDITLGGTFDPTAVGTIPIDQGGTGEVTANAGLNALLPSQSGNANKALYSDGTDTSWQFPRASLVVACSDEDTALTLGNGKVTFRMPHAMTLLEARATLKTAQASGSIFTVDINANGASVLGTKITVDNTEKTSVTALTPATITTPSLADDAEITVDIDQIGDGTATGLKIALIGRLA
jgi:hypothetical protein